MRKSELILKTEIEVKEMELLNIKDQIKAINTNERELKNDILRHEAVHNNNVDELRKLLLTIGLKVTI